MNAWLLDTNVPSESIRSLPNSKVEAWIRAQEDKSLHFSVITIGELRKGLALAPEGRRRSDLLRWLEQDLIPAFEGRILPVTNTIAEKWGTLSAQRQLAGKPLGMADGLIAATALEHGLTLVTRNGRDFDQLGVRIVNPWEYGGGYSA